MKKIIRCIIISFISLSHLILCAKETVLYSSNNVESVYSNKTSQKNIDQNTNRIGEFAQNNMFFDSLETAHTYFHKNTSEYETPFFNPLLNSNRNEIGTFPNTVSNSNPAFTASSSVVQDNSITSQNASHKSCTTFIVVIFSIFLIVIASIILRRIKTDTLKLF